MTREQQLATLDIFIKEAQTRALTGIQQGSVTRCLVSILKETGFILTVIGPGEDDVGRAAIGGDADA